MYYSVNLPFIYQNTKKMKKGFLIALSLFISLAACKSNTEKQDGNEATAQEEKFLPFGEEISAENVFSKEEMAELYNGISAVDTINAKFTSTVTAVCQRKGCWMRLELENGEEVQVKFKDYGFFMPKNIAGQEVIVEGKAYVSVMTEHERKYYAGDEGKTAEEIDEISGDSKTMFFEAYGVLLKE